MNNDKAYAKLCNALEDFYDLTLPRDGFPGIITELSEEELGICTDILTSFADKARSRVFKPTGE